MYKKLVKIDDQNRIIAATTSDFASGDEWQEVGEQDSRHWHPTITNDHGNYLYELSDGEMVERDTTSEDVLSIIDKTREAINRRVTAEIAMGCPWNDKLLPATDEWESKYLAFIDMKNDGKEFAIELDTAHNEDTFIVTHENIDEISETITAWKMQKILEAQAEKRALYEDT